jgi:peptidoglycan/xylan/chitin deacetylase (PgdA/CDA1 family)
VERLTEDAIPDNAVVVTFDDGYKDNYRNAYPILTRYSIPATVFLATGAVDEGKPLWHDLVFSAFSETTVSCLDGFGHIGGRTSWSSPEEKWNAMETVLSYLKEQGNEQREAWIGMLRDKLGIAGPSGADDLMMSWAEIVEMHRGGISFGAHTVNHPVLTRVPIEQAISEIVTSKKVIEERIGASVTSFAYPNGKEGDYNESIKTILKDAGFTCAVTTISGANQKGQDVYELRRGTPWEQDLPAFAVKMAWQKYCSWE